MTSFICVNFDFVLHRTGLWEVQGSAANLAFCVRKQCSILGQNRTVRPRWKWNAFKKSSKKSARLWACFMGVRWHQPRRAHIRRREDVKHFHKMCLLLPSSYFSEISFWRSVGGRQNRHFVSENSALCLDWKEPWGLGKTKTALSRPKIVQFEKNLNVEVSNFMSRTTWLSQNFSILKKVVTPSGGAGTQAGQELCIGESRKPINQSPSSDKWEPWFVAYPVS